MGFSPTSARKALSETADQHGPPIKDWNEQTRKVYPLMGITASHAILRKTSLMTDSKYFYRPYNGEFRRAITIYSDKVYTLEELFPETKGVPPRFPDIVGVLQEFELSDKYVIQTVYAPNVSGSGQVARRIYNGNFAFNGNELVGGKVVSTLSVDSGGEVSGKVFSNPIDVTFSNPGAWDWDDRSVPGTPIATTDGFTQFFPAGWSNRPFQDNLVSVGKTSSGSGSSSGSGGSSTTQTLTTTSSVDTLTGIKKKKDIFKFDADPSGQVDKVTGFNAKEKDILSISKSAFEIDKGTFAVAKNAKTLAKQLGTSVDIVYYQKKGELIVNANGVDPGYGDDGGVFAVLMGRPTVGAGSVQFY